MLALTQYDVDTIIAQSRRALEYLHPNNLPFRTSTIECVLALNLYGILAQGVVYALPIGPDCRT
jgi:hypothetical protein